MLIINYIDYGEMKIAIEGRTKDNNNYDVIITDVTKYADIDTKKNNRTIANLKFMASNPDSLKIIESSKDYAANMRANIIRTCLNSTFSEININQSSKDLTTSIEEANLLKLKLNKARTDLKVHVSQEKIISA